MLEHISIEKSSSKSPIYVFCFPTDVEDYEEVYELVECQLDKAHFPLDVAKFCLSLMDRFSH